MSETFVITRATLGFARVCHVFWGHTFDPTGFAKLRHVTRDFFVFEFRSNGLGSKRRVFAS